MHIAFVFSPFSARFFTLKMDPSLLSDVFLFIRLPCQKTERPRPLNHQFLSPHLLKSKGYIVSPSNFPGVTGCRSKEEMFPMPFCYHAKCTKKVLP